MTSFIPIPIIILVQILSYRELTKSSNQFELGLNHIRRLKEVAKTFTKITICFFLLTTPAVVYFVLVQYIGRSHRHLLRLHHRVFSTLPRCFNILVAVNSCINPFLYSKIQRRFSRKQPNQRNVVMRMREVNKGETETSIAISVVGEHKYKLSVNQADVINAQCVAGTNCRSSFYTVFSTLPRFSNILVAVNSIINPFLYSKIQRRFSRKQSNQRDVVMRMRKINKSETETSIAISVVGDHKYKLSVNQADV